ncbi:MAG: N-acetylmannosamine-6-phosphate 2-epimerase [Lachnospiraceae bacterium]
MTKSELFQKMEGKLIVSCQALPGEPLYVEEKSIMYLMARAAKEAGAVAIRTSSVRDVVAIKEETGLPVIGLIKIRYDGYEGYITPTMKEIDELARAGADIIALDCTLRKRGDNLTVNEFITQIKKKYPDSILMADISTYEEGMNAQKAGVDMVSSTLSGYTEYSPHLEGPDLELVKMLSKDLTIPLVAEGRIHTPGQAAAVLKNGAFAVVVGGAITRPLEITKRFIDEISKLYTKEE